MPIQLAAVGAWIIAAKKSRNISRGGNGIMLLLFLLATAFPSVTLYNYSGPKASECTEPFALPLSAGAIVCLKGLVGTRIRPWALFIIGAAVGLWPIGTNSYIT